MAGPPTFEGNCGYTPSGTLGTQTLNPGPAAPGLGQAANPQGVLYGYVMNSAGTAGMGVTFLDVIPGATVTTNTLLSGTLTAAGQSLQALNGVGIRYRGALILVTTGTAGAGNSLWD